MYLWLTDFLLRKLSFVIKEFLVTRSKDRVAINLFKLYLKITWLTCRPNYEFFLNRESLVHEIVLKLSSP